MHLAKDIIGTFSRPLPGQLGHLFIILDKGVVVIWSFDAAGNKGTLKGTQFCSRFVEIVLGGNAETVTVAADIKLVGIELQYFFLGVMVFKPEGIEKFS